MSRILTLLIALTTSAMLYGQALRVAPSGKVGIGAYEPQQQLDVRGDIFSTGFFVPSDGRLSSIEGDFSYGLDAVLQLEPKVYRHSGEAGLLTTETHVGVMAQDLMKIAPELVSNFSHVDSKTSEEVEDDYLQVDDAAIKYMLINAIKEQNELIKSLQDELSELKSSLANRGEALTATTLVVSDQMMHQNAPNPYRDFTQISYEISKNVRDAEIRVYDFAGALVKSVDIHGGRGQIQISAEDLPAGIYSYSLIVNDEIVSSKKMSVF